VFSAAGRADAGIDDATVGQLVGPLDLAGALIFGRVLAGRTGPFDVAELARLELTGLDTCLIDQVASASVELDPDPLGNATPTPVTSASSAAPLFSGRALPATPATTQAFATPFLA
jgi:hypothetical protein